MRYFGKYSFFRFLCCYVTYAVHNNISCGPNATGYMCVGHSNPLLCYSGDATRCYVTINICYLQ